METTSAKQRCLANGEGGGAGGGGLGGFFERRINQQNARLIDTWLME